MLHLILTMLACAVGAMCIMRRDGIRAKLISMKEY